MVSAMGQLQSHLNCAESVNFEPLVDVRAGRPVRDHGGREPAAARPSLFPRFVWLRTVSRLRKSWDLDSATEDCSSIIILLGDPGQI